MFKDHPQLFETSVLVLDPSTSGKEGKAFFSEGKKQKTFGPAVAEFPSSYIPGNKSFLVLFFKKEPLALLVTGQDLRPLVCRVICSIDAQRQRIVRIWPTWRTELATTERGVSNGDLGAQNCCPNGDVLESDTTPKP